MGRRPLFARRALLRAWPAYTRAQSARLTWRPMALIPGRIRCVRSSQAATSYRRTTRPRRRLEYQRLPLQCQRSGEKQATAIGRFDAKINDKQMSSAAELSKRHSLNGVAVSRYTAPTTWRHPVGLAANYAGLSPFAGHNFTYVVTREAFTNGGDSSQNSIVFRFIFQPVNFSRDSAAPTPVHNFVDDLSWSKGVMPCTMAPTSDSSRTTASIFPPLRYATSTVGYDASGAWSTPARWRCDLPECRFPVSVIICATR